MVTPVTSDTRPITESCLQSTDQTILLPGHFCPRSSTFNLQPGFVLALQTTQWPQDTPVAKKQSWFHLDSIYLVAK